MPALLEFGKVRAGLHVAQTNARGQADDIMSVLIN
jgi:hypothetical protein